MIWIVLTVAVLVCGLLLCCICLLLNKICSLKGRVRELKKEAGTECSFPCYRRIYLNDAPVGNGHQIRIRHGVYDKAARIVPLLAPGLSVSAFVSNVMEEHLKRHWELLKEECEYGFYNDLPWKI